IENEQWIKSRSGPINVILKALTVSIDTIYKFFEERPIKATKVHDYFKKWQVMTLEKGMPSEYFSPVINDYVTFNDEEFEENKNLFLEFVKSDEINTNAKPYNKQEKKNYMSK
ncbi:33406_t:CDS:2, partial [Gigaspora margarita]